MRKFLETFKSYVFSSEDDPGLSSLSKHRTETCGIDKEPMFVLVDSSGLSNPSSKELLINDDDKDTVLRKFFNKYIKPSERPSTSKELAIPADHITESESKEEVEVVDINLQSENDIPVDDNEIDENESIVLAYIRNKNVLFEIEGTLLSTKKKSSILGSVPKMETILEGEQFSAFPSASKRSLVPKHSVEDMDDD